MTLLTADDVLNKKFQATKFREGYEQDEVDEFLDEVVEAMRQLEAENADLKAKLDAANREWPSSATGRRPLRTRIVAPFQHRCGGAGRHAAPSPPARPARARSRVRHARAGPAPARRARRQRPAEGERIVSEARATGEQIVREAEDQRNRTLAQLEKERANLEHKIDELRRFESDYRTRLKSYLQRLLANVEDGGEAPSPAGSAGREPPAVIASRPIREHLREWPTEPLRRSA